MTGRRFQDISKDQCEAARGVREKHGVISALEYLIGDKLMTYAETAVGRPEFARELPRFVAEIRSIFSAEEIRLYLQHLERTAAQEEEALAADPAHDDFIVETPEQRTAGRARLAWLKELLTASVLGRGERIGPVKRRAGRGQSSSRPPSVALFVNCASSESANRGIHNGDAAE